MGHASGAKIMTSVSGVLVVDLTPAAGTMRYIEGRAAAYLVREIPRGVTVELQIGGLSPLDGLMGPLVEALRPAGSIVIRGTDPAGVADMYRVLSLGLAREASL